MEVHDEHPGAGLLRIVRRGDPTIAHRHRALRPLAGPAAHAPPAQDAARDVAHHRRPARALVRRDPRASAGRLLRRATGRPRAWNSAGGRDPARGWAPAHHALHAHGSCGRCHAAFLAHWLPGLPRPGVSLPLPVGGGDVLVGLLALPVAFYLGSGRPGGRAVAYAWNWLGILDLAVALTLGFLSSPTRFQLLALDAPNRLVGAYPLVMIPAFAVPLALILHGLSLWQLRRSGRRARYAGPAKVMAKTGS